MQRLATGLIHARVATLPAPAASGQVLRLITDGELYEDGPGGWRPVRRVGSGGNWATLTTPAVGPARSFNRSRTIHSLLTAPSGTSLREIGNICHDPTSATPYRLYYPAFPPPYSETGQINVYLATSVDGRVWTNGTSPIISGRYLEDPYVMLTPQGWELYAEDKTAQPQKLMRVYRSTDGLTGWTDLGNAGIPSTAGSFGAVDVSSPIVWMEGSRRYCLYEGRAVGQDGAIGLAYLDGTDPTAAWTVANGGLAVATGKNDSYVASNPGFYGASGAPTVAWSSILVPDDLIRVGNLYYMLAHGYTIPDNRFVPILLTSPDLLTWTDTIGSELINPDSSAAPGETWMFGDPAGASIYFTTGPSIRLALTRYEVGYGDMYRSVYDKDLNGVVDDSQRLGGVLASEFAQKNAIQTITAENTFNLNGRNVILQRTSTGKQWHFDINGSGALGFVETGVAEALSIDPAGRTVSIYGTLLQTTVPVITSTQTASFTATCAAAETIYLVNAASGAVPAALPSAALAANQNRRLTFKKTDSSSNAVTLTPTGGQTIDGSATLPISQPYWSFTLISDGSNWQVL